MGLMRISAVQVQHVTSLAQNETPLKVSGNHETGKGHEYVQLHNSYYILHTNTEVSEKSKPKPSYMYQRS